jgi:hypothetical protein
MSGLYGGRTRTVICGCLAEVHCDRDVLSGLSRSRLSVSKLGCSGIFGSLEESRA